MSRSLRIIGQFRLSTSKGVLLDDVLLVLDDDVEPEKCCSSMTVYMAEGHSLDDVLLELDDVAKLSRDMQFVKRDCRRHPYKSETW